ncbi:MAG: cereblon family protein [Pseudomonadales bacterium]|nr:cereblon family protein [Pseudomonadales bacterium]
MIAPHSPLLIPSIPFHLLELGEEDPVAKILAAMREDHEDEANEVIRCKHCNHIITLPSHLLTIDDKFIHEFSNPAGMTFEVQCYGEASGTTVSGKPTDYYSWFPGYLWQYCYCENCGKHIGWFFSKEDDQFYGLNIASLKGDL